MTGVLVISRDPELRKLIRRALEELPVRITRECSSSKEVPEAMAEAPAAIVVIDMFLPGTSGLEVVKMLLQMNDGTHCILISRTRTRASIDRAFRYGARDVLLFPLSAETLRDTVAHRLDLPTQLKESPTTRQAAPAAPAKP